MKDTLPLPELKACPFCGGKAEWDYEAGSEATVQCSDCSIHYSDSIYYIMQDVLPDAEFNRLRLAYDSVGHRYSAEGVAVARKFLVDKWNTRPIPPITDEAVEGLIRALQKIASTESAGAMKYIVESAAMRHEAGSALTTLRAYQAEQEGWQPIESAPRWEPILVTDGEVVYEAKFDGEECTDPFYNEWAEVDRGGKITHWQPLPSSPKSEEI